MSQSMGGAGFRTLPITPFEYLVDTATTAPGANMHYVTPADSCCQLLTAACVFTSSAAPGNRNIAIQLFLPTGQMMFEGLFNFTHTAGFAKNYVTIFEGIDPKPPDPVVGRIYLGTATDILLPPSSPVNISAYGIQGADQFSAANFVFRRFRGTQILYYT